MAYNKFTRNKSTKIQPWLFLLFGFLILAAIFGGFYARYVHQESQKEAPVAEQFYFTSDLLSEDGKEYTLASNITQVTFELRNYEDKLRSSDSNIEYTYSVKKDGIEKETASGTISKSVNGGNQEQIAISDLSAGTYTVTATAKKPFHKVLKGTFKIPKESEDLNYTINDSAQSAYVTLQIAADAFEGKVKIQWPAGLIPDSTQEIFKDTKNVENDEYAAGNVTMDVKKYTSYTCRFFKKDISKDYSTGKDITVEKVTN